MEAKDMSFRIIMNLEEWTYANNSVEECCDTILSLLTDRKYAINALLCELIEAAAKRQEMQMLLGIDNIDELMGLSQNIQKQRGEKWY